MREYEAEHGPFTEAKIAEAEACIDRLFGPEDAEHGGSARPSSSPEPVNLTLDTEPLKEFVD